MEHDTDKNDNDVIIHDHIWTQDYKLIQRTMLVTVIVNVGGKTFTMTDNIQKPNFFFSKIDLVNNKISVNIKDNGDFMVYKDLIEEEIERKLLASDKFRSYVLETIADHILR